MMWFTFAEIGLALFWGIVVVVVTRLIRDRLRLPDSVKAHMMPLLYIKLFGALMVGMVYLFYYGGGDTTNYYITTLQLTRAFFDDPAMGLKFWTMELMGPERYRLAMEEPHIYGRYFGPMIYKFQEAPFMVCRVAFIPSVLALGHYFGTAMLLCWATFWGVWGLFVTFARYFPNNLRELAIAIIFMPSIWFWGSGFLKDSVTFGALGLLTFAIDRLLIQRRFNLLLLLVALGAAQTIFIIKQYILYSFVPFAVIWVGLATRSNINNAFVRASVTPFLFVVTGVFSFLAVNSLSEDSHRYSVDNVAMTAHIVQKDLTSAYNYADGVGSSYNIGEFDPSVTGMVTKAPEAIFASLFRPFIWEAKNPLMLLAAVEAAFMLLLFLRVLVQTRVVGLFYYLFGNPVLLYSFGYGVAFAFMVGLTSGNFGNLVRYKIPCIPFFLVAVLIANQYAKGWQADPEEDEGQPTTADAYRKRFARLHGA